MMFHIFVTVFFIGFAILLGILGVMRGLHRSSIFQPPDMPGESAADVLLDDGRDQACERGSEVGERRCRKSFEGLPGP
jgi:hypothetical protein